MTSRSLQQTPLISIPRQDRQEDTQSLSNLTPLRKSSIQSVSSCSHLHLNLHVDLEIQLIRANSGGERNNSPPAHSVRVPGQCITTRLELLHTILILHTLYSDYVYAGLENLTSTWLVRGPSILQFTAAMREYAFLVRTKYTTHSTAYALRHIIHPVYPVPTLPRLPLRKMGFKMPHIEGSGMKRGEARRCTGTCVLLAATGTP